MKPTSAALLVCSALVSGVAVAELPRFGGTWTSHGPAPIEFARVEGMLSQNNAASGPVNVVIAHPTNADILWIGAVNGGIWKTIDATASSPTWIPAGDDLPSLAIGAMALDPTDPAHNTLVAGFGRFSCVDGKESGGMAAALQIMSGGRRR